MSIFDLVVSSSPRGGPSRSTPHPGGGGGSDTDSVGSSSSKSVSPSSSPVHGRRHPGTTEGGVRHSIQSTTLSSGDELENDGDHGGEEDMFNNILRTLVCERISKENY